jgi:hypothetical protein
MNHDTIIETYPGESHLPHDGSCQVQNADIDGRNFHFSFIRLVFSSFCYLASRQSLTQQVQH